ncbi:hypothetical protein GCM10027026_44720 [Myroides odoratimimus subsp. xuanwuensis]
MAPGAVSSGPFGVVAIEITQTGGTDIDPLFDLVWSRIVDSIRKFFWRPTNCPQGAGYRWRLDVGCCATCSTSEGAGGSRRRLLRNLLDQRGAAHCEVRPSQATWSERFERPIQKPSITWVPGVPGSVAAPRVTNSGE